MKKQKNSISDLRLICEYLRAVQNETAVDMHSFRLIGLDAASYGKFPRPSKWLSKFKKFAFLSRFVHRISLPFWFFLGPFVFWLQCQLLRASFSYVSPVKFDEAGQVLAFSYRALDVLHQSHIESIPRQWVEMPWVPLSNLPIDTEALPLTALVNDADFKLSLKLSILAHRVFQGRHGITDWGLQSYTAWRWFLVRLAVDKLPGPLTMVEHFDRWAVLIDSSVQRSRSSRKKRTLTVVQHGSVNATQKPRGLGFLLPNRLRSAKNLWAYSAEDVKVFKDEILSQHCGDSGLVVRYYQPRIHLTEMAIPEGPPSILFVGYPLCEAAHCGLLSALLLEGDWQIFYKPHPSSPASTSVRRLPWTVVEGNSLFPRVDVLISYPSTLVTEYGCHDIQAVVHRMDVNAIQLIDRLPEILQKIDSRGSHSSLSSL